MQAFLILGKVSLPRTFKISLKGQFPAYMAMIAFSIGALALVDCGGGSSEKIGREHDIARVAESYPEPATGPLTVSQANPRFFADQSGKVIYLTGSHTWANLQDFEKKGTKSSPFDYAAHLRFLRKYNHNFTRIWAWESSRTDIHYAIGPLPYCRSGPGSALDGEPRFDLTQFDAVYFDRLRSRVAAARDQGVYVMVMLFQGVSVHKHGLNAWSGHPYNPANNINQINGDLDGDGAGKEVHTLKIPSITRLQEAYVRKVVNTVNDLDNVIYEICNESDSESTRWQYHMVSFIHEYEMKKPKQHPVVMTVEVPKDNTVLFESPAEAISPGPGYGGDGRPVANRNKVVIADTDHFWGIGGSQAWVWKSFLRGINPIFMDPYDGKFLGKAFDREWEQIRLSMGYTLNYARRLNLTTSFPRNDLSSSEYCLADPGREYLVYLPPDSHWIEATLSPFSSKRFLWRINQLWKEIRHWFKLSVMLDISAAHGELDVEWFDPSTGRFIQGGKVIGGAKRTFQAPFSGDAVLYVSVPFSPRSRQGVLVQRSSVRRDHLSFPVCSEVSATQCPSFH